MTWILQGMFNGGLDMGWKRIIPSRWLSRKRPKNFVRGEERSPGSTCSARMAQVAETTKEVARSLGLGPTRITTADPSDRLDVYERWIAEG
mmetsp:Transcript_6513/g.13075  ORF Transcript_6513/g.13075 Transcript_6513/m.13075 type:complete len:91 (-) Transcript_6513:1826-2098(-)